jgi:hypothetical protein
MIGNIQSAERVGELSLEELDAASAGLKIGPLSIESGDGLFAITVSGYGIWGGQGCLGILTPDRVLGACIR